MSFDRLILYYSGWNPVTRQCIATQTDPQNWYVHRAICLEFWLIFNYSGGYQNVCTAPALGTATCTDGKCGFACNSQTIIDSTASSCIPNSPSSCGTSGKACTNPLSHGRAVCNAGTCGQTCDSVSLSCLHLRFRLTISLGIYL